MKGTIRRILAVVLAMAMIITGISYTPQPVKADEIIVQTTQTVTELNAPTEIVLYDLRAENGGYKPVFEDADEDVAVAEGDQKYFNVYADDLLVGTVSQSGEVITESSFDMQEGVTYAVSVEQVVVRQKEDGTGETLTAKSDVINYTYNTKQESLGEPLDNGVAQIFVNTVRTDGNMNHDLYTSGIKNKINSTIVVKDTNGDVIVDGGTISLRGNSTAGGQKKPYNIKFASKQNVFGCGKAKKWSLLANTFDKSMIRNEIGMQFHRELEDNYQDDKFTSNGKTVDLYVDGNYLGSYLLLESVEVGSTRVDINSSDETNDEILLELDSTNRDAGSDAHLDQNTSIYNMNFTINDPEGPGTDGDPDEIAAYNAQYQAKKDNVSVFLNEFETKLKAAETGSFDEVAAIIDVDTFVNFYITAELFKITDISYSSVRFYTKKQADGSYKLYAGPLWDLDLSSGNGNGDDAKYEIMKAQTNPWFGALMKNETFKQKVIDRYKELLPKIKALYKTGGTVDTLVRSIQKSIDSNYSKAYNVYEGTNANGYGEGWKIDKIYTAGSDALTSEAASTSGNVHGSVVTYEDYSSYVSHYKTWLKNRNEYLMEQWGIEDTVGLHKTSEGHVVISWDEQAGATGYSVTFTKAATALTARAVENADGTTTEYVPAGTTSFDFTENGINLADNSPVVVQYTTDETADENAEYMALADEMAEAEVSVIPSVTTAADGLKTTVVATVRNSGTAATAFDSVDVYNGTEIVAGETVSPIEPDGSATVTIQVTAETAGEYTYKVQAGDEYANIKVNCFDTDNIAYTTNDNLTAYDSGAQYAEYDVTGNPIANVHQFGAESYSGTTGADGVGIRFTCNNVNDPMNETWSAYYMSKAYAEMKTNGTPNIIQINYLTKDSATNVYTSYIKTVYIMLSEVVEDTPDYTGVILPGDDGWTKVTDGTGAGADGSSWYVGTELYEATAKSNDGIRSLQNSGTQVPWGGGDANTVKGAAFSIGIQNQDAIKSVWINEYKLGEKGSYGTNFYINNDVVTFSQSICQQYKNEDGIFYITLRYSTGDKTFPVKIVEEQLAAPEGLVNSPAADGSLPYYFAWQGVTGAATYNFYVYKNGEKVFEAENILATAYNADEYFENADNDTYEIRVAGVKSDGTKGAQAILSYIKSGHPDFVISNVEIRNFTPEVDSTFTVAITVQNIGDAVTIPDGGQLVIHFTHDNGTRGDIAVDDDYNIIAGAGTTIEKNGTLTCTFRSRVTEAMLSGLILTIGGKAVPEGTLADLESVNTNNLTEIEIPVSNIDAPKNVTAKADNDTSTATVTWEAPDLENTYSYNVYLDGVLKDTTNNLISTIEGIEEGKHYITVKALNGNSESYEAGAYIVVYNVQGLNWVEWPEAVADSNGMKYYIADNYLDEPDLNQGWKSFESAPAELGGNPSYTSAIVSEGGKLVSVSINGTTYTDDGVNVDFNGDQIRINQNLFKLGDDVQEKIFTILVQGETAHAYLLKIINTNYTQPIKKTMDWTPLYDQNDPAKDYVFEVANGTKESVIEYKVLGTSYTDLDWDKIFTAYRGYAPNWGYFEIDTDGSHNLFADSLYEDENKQRISTTATYFAQVNADYIENYNDTSDMSIFKVMPYRGCASVIPTVDENGNPDGGTRIESASESAGIFNIDGNGLQFYTQALAPNKYYAFCFVAEDGTYVMMAIRVKGDGEKWIQAGATKSDATDINKLPYYYHIADDANNIFDDAAIYYDNSDLSLSNLSVYNGDHLVITTDAAKQLAFIGTLPDYDNIKIMLARASVDEDGNFVVPTDEQFAGDDNWDTKEHGDQAKWIEITYNEYQWGVDGRNNLQIKLPELLKELPIHSGNGGSTDDAYYYMKVYYDTNDGNSEYVPIPLKITANIPDIEPVNGLTAGYVGEDISVSWVNTENQNINDYLYDIVVDGNIVMSNIPAGSYVVSTAGVDYGAGNHSVQVIAKWCEQTQGETIALTSDLGETVTGSPETPTIPTDTAEHKWVLIDGEHILPVTNDKYDAQQKGSGQQVNARIEYYTDDDLNAVVGYNGAYIAMNGSADYFAGNTTRILIQKDGAEERVFEPVRIFNKSYEGQVLMNAAKMFETYGDDWTATETVLYYTVKVIGNDAEKDFHFRITPNAQAQQVMDTAEWVTLKGEYELPVNFDYEYNDVQTETDASGEMVTKEAVVNASVKVKGIIEYYDAPSKTHTYAGTGYNSYYISLLGNSDVYVGNNIVDSSSNEKINNVKIDVINTTNEQADDSMAQFYLGATSQTPDYANAETLNWEDKAVTIYNQYYPGEVQLNAADVFTVTNTTTYYLLRITGTKPVYDTDGTTLLYNDDGTPETTTLISYLPVRITVQTGDVKLEGYQMNTNYNTGAVSEYNPSFRVMSSASPIMEDEEGVLHGVVGYGTIYGLKSQVQTADDLYLNSTNSNVYSYQADENGIYEKGVYANFGTEDTQRTYWGLTFKHLNYSYNAIISKYVFRAYALLDDGTPVYDEASYGFTDSDEVNVYNIAANLYNGKKMSNEAAHNFLYNNVLNIVTINNNIGAIGTAMLSAVGNDNYTLANSVYHDLFDYARGQKSYKDDYIPRQTNGFVAKSQEDGGAEMLAKLNSSTGTEYDTILDWLYGENNDKNLLYKKVSYSKNQTVMQ